MNPSSPLVTTLADLFETDLAAVEVEPVTAARARQPPTDLDSLILADAETESHWVGVRWYRGVDAAGVVRVFQFRRGSPIELWRRLLSLQSLQSVAGPVRTQLAAHAAPRADAAGGSRKAAFAGERSAVEERDRMADAAGI